MSAKEWLGFVAQFLVLIFGAAGWFFSWWRYREHVRKQKEKEAEQRGIRGWKFRLMYRTLAKDHPDWPVNGEDED